MRTLAVTGLCAFMLSNASAQEGLRLKVRGLAHGPVRVLPEGRRIMLQFRSYPGAEVREQLARRGVRVLEYVPDNGLMVSADPELDLTGLGVVWAGPLDPAAKISPRLADSTGSAYLVVFHRDADMRQARRLLAASGFDIVENRSLLPGQLLAAGPFERIAELAAAEEVAYVMPASPDLVAGNPVFGCSGAIAEAGPIGEYVEVGRGWPADANGNFALHYNFQSLTDKLDPATAKSEIERAFREWQRYANVTLSEGDRADAVRTIAVRFARREHGDPYAFDGPGGILAHTYYPSPPNAEPIAGDMHLDADENWRTGASVDLFSVALHEVGHALGLGHSDQPGAVMYPYYRTVSGLASDDIAGIRNLYGSPDSTPVQPPIEPPVQPPIQPPVQPPPPAPADPPATPASDTTPPALRIASPSSTMVSTSAVSIQISGTATDNVGVTEVKWSTSNGDAGAASGTIAWSARVPLLVGTSVVTIRAYDAAGNSAWRAISVVRR